MARQRSRALDRRAPRCDAAVVRRPDAGDAVRVSPMLDIAGIAVSPDHYIDGRRVASRETFELRSPIDQRELGHISEGLLQHVEEAVLAAQRAFPAWSALTATERKPYLDRYAAEIGKRADDFCRVESTDAGVLLSRMRHG